MWDMFCSIRYLYQGIVVAWLTRWNWNRVSACRGTHRVTCTISSTCNSFANFLPQSTFRANHDTKRFHPDNSARRTENTYFRDCSPGVPEIPRSHPRRPNRPITNSHCPPERVLASRSNHLQHHRVTDDTRLIGKPHQIRACTVIAWRLSAVGAGSAVSPVAAPWTHSRYWGRIGTFWHEHKRTRTRSFRALMLGHLNIPFHYR